MLLHTDENMVSQNVKGMLVNLHVRMSRAEVSPTILMGSTYASTEKSEHVLLDFFSAPRISMHTFAEPWCRHRVRRVHLVEIITERLDLGLTSHAIPQRCRRMLSASRMTLRTVHHLGSQGPQNVIHLFTFLSAARLVFLHGTEHVTGEGVEGMLVDHHVRVSNFHVVSTVLVRTTNASTEKGEHVFLHLLWTSNVSRD
jgi:hypothetical protein